MLIISVFVSFLLNSNFVFGTAKDDNAEKWWKILIKTYISYSFTGLILAELLTAFWLNLIHLENYVGFLLPIAARLGITITAVKLAGYIAPILNLVVSVPINFVINKFWAYRKRKSDS